jgi:hypothetical protein
VHKARLPVDNPAAQLHYPPVAAITQVLNYNYGKSRVSLTKIRAAVRSVRTASTQATIKREPVAKTRTHKTT